MNHTGNKRFKLIVESSLQRYSNAPSKLAKSAIVSDIVETIRQSSPGGGVVKKEGNMWYEAGDHLAREVSEDPSFIMAFHLYILEREDLSAHTACLVLK